MRLVDVSARAVRAGLALMLAAAAAAPARAQQWTVPVATAVVYPREIIRDDMLTDRTWDARPAGAHLYAEQRSALIGKVTRMTLLPGQPVPMSGVEPPRLVTLGGQVRIVFEQNGITIVAFGAALQAGAEGDIVRVRNTDSGLTVSGKVQADGSVRVGEG